MPVAPETVQVFADAIEAQRLVALDGFDRAAVHLDDIRARLRYAVGDPVPIEAAISTFAETAVEGGRAFQLMLSLVNDLWRVSQVERKALPRPVDLVAHMDGLVDRMARTAKGASQDLEDFAGMLRGGPETGTSDDIVRLATTIRDNHEKLQSDLVEALQLGSCQGSA